MKLIFDERSAKYERTVYGASCSNCDYYVGLALDDGDGRYRGSVNEKFIEAIIRMMVIDDCYCEPGSKWEYRLR